MGQATIRSMTGFGRGTGQSPLGQFTAELRTVNNRYHDASVALPRELQPLEMRLRTLLKQRVPRGKVDCRVRWVPAQAQLPTVELNLPLAEAYHERLRQLAALTGEKQVPLQLLTTLPGVLEIGALDIDEEQLWGSLEPVLKSALQALDRERARGGAALAAQLSELGGQLRAELASIEARKDEVVAVFRQRLSLRLEQLLSELEGRMEPGRLEMEVALFADRSDLTEEVVRLHTHLDRFDQLLTQGGDDTVGRSLDFLIQEMNREVNTICSKSRDTGLTGHGLEMKSLLERIREQVQNLQ